MLRLKFSGTYWHIIDISKNDLSGKSLCNQEFNSVELSALEASLKDDVKPIHGVLTCSVCLIRLINYADNWIEERDPYETRR